MCVCVSVKIVYLLTQMPGHAPVGSGLPTGSFNSQRHLKLPGSPGIGLRNAGIKLDEIKVS